MNILIVVGTRPEAIKMAPVISALRSHPEGPMVRVCVTAQHRNLLDQALADFNIVADYDLDLMRTDQTLAGLTSALLMGLDGVLAEARPDLVLVHGDTTTSFAGALASFYRRIPVGHVEAGLRTHDPAQPFPEELNRRMTDALCHHHFAPTEGARANLLREGVAPEGIVVTGNTAIDAVLQVAQEPYAFPDEALEALGRERALVLVTAHRRESFGEPFAGICAALRRVAEENEGVEIALPVHPNPNIRCAAWALLGGHERIHLLEPLAYRPFVHLMKRARLILTDSGGIQEEAPSLGVPVLVLRAATERPEALAAGTARLVGTDPAAVVDATNRLLRDADARAAMTGRPNPFGDGRAAEQIAARLLEKENRTP